MADRSWVDSLSEDWISQPRSSSPFVPHPPLSKPGTINSHPSFGTTRVRDERSYINYATTNRHRRRHSNEALDNATSPRGTTQMYNRRMVDTPEWKRKLLEDMGSNGGKDLFSPLQLENLFRPPTVGPGSSPRLPPPQATPPKSPGRSYLPITRSSPFPGALPTLEEESGSGNSTQDPLKPQLSQNAPETGAQPVLLPLTRQSRLSHRRTHSSPPSERVSDHLKGKRKAEKYADIEHDTRSRITLTNSLRSKPRSIRIARPSSRWLKGSLRDTSDDMRNEVISPVSVGGLDCMDRGSIKAPPLLRRGASNPESDLASYPRDHQEDHRERDDTLGDLHGEVGISRSVRRFLRRERESSVYPSSPPVVQSRYPPEEVFQDENEGEAEYDENYLDDTAGSLASPFISPQKPPPTPPTPEKRLLARDNEPSDRRDSNASALLRNIRNHKDAPRSPVKSQEARPQHSPASSDGENDPFFTPHPFRFMTELPSTTPQTPPTDGSDIPRSKNSGSPLKLFSGAYDTYTNEKLRKRLGELEESEDQEQPKPNRTISFNNGTEEPSDRESERSFSRGSMVVNRLEAMARRTERNDSPPTRYVRRRSKMVHYDETVEKITKTTTTTTKVVDGHQRQASTSPRRPSPHRSARKHRRWQSDESTVVPNDGVAGPKSPVKERTPKRARRGSVLAAPRPGSSGTPNRLLESPANGRRRIYTAIEDGSILASSRRQQRSRANSKESQVSARKPIVRTGSPTPTPRKKKHAVVGQLVIAPALNSPRSGSLRKIVFSGSKGDGMQGESFEMPTPPRENHMGTRKGSVTTQDFLEQAEQVMARIRELGIRAAGGYGSDGERQSRPPNNDNEDRIVPPKVLKVSHENATHENESSNNPVTSSMVERLQAVALSLGGRGQAKFAGMGDEDQDQLAVSRSSKSSRSSVRVISNVPEVLSHHLATKTTNDMTFDKNTLAWVSRTPAKEGEDDPLKDISDLTVDSKEEERVLELARNQWGALGSTPDGVEKSGVWRSSRVIDESDLRGIDCGPSGDTWDKSHWSNSRALSSSVGSASSQRTNDSEFDVHNARTVTRTTSYGTEEAIEEEVKETDVAQHDHDDNGEDNSDEKRAVDKIQTLPPGFASGGFSSSPLKNEVILDDGDGDDNDDDDLDVDGFLEHGSLRRSGRSNSSFSYHSVSRRKSIGKTFIGRPVSRITEVEEEASHKIRRPDLEREFGRLSLSSALTPLQTPFKSQLSAIPPPSTKKKGDVSFYLSPLPDISYRFETTEALISLELSYITSRRGPKATSKAVEASFSIAQSNLVKHLTDVEPYDPYWDFIKCLKLSDRKLETLYTLNEFCPRVAELDASNNELGQLTGVPESVMNLNVQRNCLTNVTFFGHLTNLQFLDISGNGLESLDALAPCLHLRELKVDNNALTNIEGVFKIEGLLSLRCRHNRLESVDFAKSELKRLTELDLRGNQLVDVNGLEALPSLVHLNLDQNLLATLSIPPSIKLETIRSIKLTQNSFTSFDVTPFPNLRILYMDNNNLSRVVGLTRAKSIDAVSFREQTTPTGTFDLDINRMFEARKLYLSSNPIGSLSQLQAGFLNLQFLEMAGCHLRSLPKNIAALIPNVRVLNLNYNALSDLRPLASLNRLVKLSCAGNRISNVRKLGQALERCRGIKWVDFRANPVTTGFYPPTTTVVKQERGDEYAKDPFEIVPAEEEKDLQHHGRLDLRTKCERRRYWVVLAGACRKLKGADGLTLMREEVEREDEIWKEMVARGWVKEEKVPEGDE
ncbi:hypothetical protein K440DRAFT_595759 [Wilcoxina mikolae CBS 423.85]|nr:hypothetical protein K440DRAFT_595759 [Wilcoxina mikolae CBS 423.85]